MTQTATEKNYIPKVDRGVLLERSKRARPIYAFGGTKRYIKPVDIFGIAFTWDPAPAPGFLGLGWGSKAKNLTPLRDVTTYHTWAYYGFFKPTIAECLAQIPEDILDKVVAFEIVNQPRDSEALNAGYHVATTRLYGRA